MESFTTTLTSKGQFTVPKPIRQKLAVEPGTKFEVAVISSGFVAKPRVKSNILNLAGILKKYDDGKPTDEIIEKALTLAARDIAKRKK
ncbi:MAG: hypothetical protein CEN88_469 [Candidatus Berkelbacteria bacterium Licking1014_2]|uniref:SpoVT-AbrB domain-containing protein n=1 Tax=Candidatus Berkelbacteria bacterium Licking1014_2 TaxID=2017146 RepID=A0A554LRJ7_9BACT|nr:MAG: hypothetical protein CEN88_469 [Candidatus Berkelbacteria bacterium Licking1014_2]